MSLSHAFKGQIRLAKLPLIKRPDPNATPLPPVVSINRLPYHLQFWIRRCVERREVSRVTPGDVAEGKFAWMSSNPGHYENNTNIRIPNPFLRHRLQLETENFSDNPKPDTKVLSPINRRRQKAMVKKYPAVLLPPSVRNPIENSAVISMDVEGLGKRYIRYGPDWKLFPEVKKGLYAGRAFVFKGHKRERQREIRQEEIAERVASMDERIRKWREVKRAEKSSGKSTMPW